MEMVKKNPSRRRTARRKTRKNPANLREWLDLLGPAAGGFALVALDRMNPDWWGELDAGMKALGLVALGVWARGEKRPELSGAAFAMAGYYVAQIADAKGKLAEWKAKLGGTPTVAVEGLYPMPTLQPEAELGQVALGDIARGGGSFPAFGLGDIVGARPFEGLGEFFPTTPQAMAG